MDSVLNRTEGRYRIRLDEIPEYAQDIPEFPLGSLGNIPVAYAAFQVDPDEEAERAKTSYYLYANREYCRLAGCKLEDILGVSHLEVSNSEDEEWPVDCYQAAFYGKSVNGIAYSPLVRSWVCYNIGPSAVEGCCICAFIPIDDEQRMQQMSVDEKTSVVISELLATLAGEENFEVAMNEMLRKTAKITKADRVSVFECHGPSTEITFEWCAEGVESQLGTFSDLSSAVLKAWFASLKDDPVSLIPDTSRLARYSPPLYDWCVQTGVKSLMAAPYFIDGEVVGFLGAYNFQLDGSVDIKRVFSEIRSFVGTRIENKHLIQSLDWAGKHDALTGLLNRRGFQAALDTAGVGEGDGSVVVALIDVDDFKHTNDEYGHACGDVALCEMSRIMEEVFPEDAILCRTGGDEFLVCLAGESADRIEEVIDAFKAKRMEYDFEGVHRSMTASIGYSKHSAQSFSMREAFAEADKALYADKRNK